MSRATLSDNEIAAIVGDPDFLLCNEDSLDSLSEGDNDSDSDVSDSELDKTSNNSTFVSTDKPEGIPQWNKVSDVFIDNTIKLNFVPNGTGYRNVKNCNGLEPVDVFYKFFPVNIFDFVADQTNLYFSQCVDRTVDFPPHSRVRKWVNVSSNDIKAFVAAEIGMGLCNKSELPSYFQNTFWLTRTPGFRELFTASKYTLIKSFLHFNNNENQIKKGNIGYDPLYKIRPIIDMTKDTYLHVFQPGQSLSVDETMVKFKGRLSFKQYLPSKPSTKWGIKIWSLCDSETGYLLRFSVYTGREVQQVCKDGLAERIVKNLLGGLENRGHVVYMDNFYSSVNLFLELKNRGFGACGTVRANRKNLPLEIKYLKKKKGDLPDIWIEEEYKMLACSWQDTGRVNMLSTVGDAGVTEVDVKSKKGTRKVIKPNVQVLYNKNMGGVDLFDQYCSTYPYGRKSMKWYQTIWHFLIEVALVNGCISYNFVNPNNTVTHKKFREIVIDGLIVNYKKLSIHKRAGRKISTGNAGIDRLCGRHFPTQFEDKSHKPNCVVCSIMPSSCKKKGKGICKRKQTTFYCPDCCDNPPLCVTPCFRIYHTKQVYKKKCQC